MGGGGQQSVGPIGQPFSGSAMKIGDGPPKALRISSHLVEGGQWIGAIESRVLNPLGHHGTGNLLETHDEIPSLRLLCLIQPVWIL